MGPKPAQISRRAFMAGAATSGALLTAGIPVSAAIKATPILRTIPANGEKIPVVGMGTWITFNVGSSPRLRDARAEVLKTFFDRGGAVIDSSPMYGSSEAVIGYCLDKIGKRDSAFTATKVWTPLTGRGVSQMADSRRYWRVPGFDLMQVHNLVNWEDHLDTLARDRDAGRIRHIGITTSHGRRHSDFARIMTDERIDTVQFTYNIVDRAAESRLLPMSAERGRAVIINRPFMRGALFRKFAHHPLPRWAAEFDCKTWAQFFLKFVISHPAVTCVIPATSRVDHMTDNMDALYGRLPDPELRTRMVRYIERL